MKTSNGMRTIITKIARKHGIDLTKVGAWLRLEMPYHDRLVVECIGTNRISVAHYFDQNGDAMKDPEIVFMVAPNADVSKPADWYPIEITQVMTGCRQLVNFKPDGEIDSFYPYAQKDVAAFGAVWARNIREQDWLKDGKKTSEG